MLPALLQALQMTMIACDENCPASLTAGDLGKGKTILLSGLGHVDHDDIEIVFIESSAHFGAGRDRRKAITLLFKYIGEQNPDEVVVFYNQHFANSRHFAPLAQPSIRRECCFALRRLLLAEPHIGIDTVTQQQFPMVAALDDAAVVEHQDLVGFDDRRQPMGDN